MKYQKEKKNCARTSRLCKKADSILLATDPDREGGSHSLAHRTNSYKEEVIFLL